jgi:hypothetical protein
VDELAAPIELRIQPEGDVLAALALTECVACAGAHFDVGSVAAGGGEEEEEGVRVFSIRCAPNEVTRP